MQYRPWIWPSCYCIDPNTCPNLDPHRAALTQIMTLVIQYWQPWPLLHSTNPHNAVLTPNHDPQLAGAGGSEGGAMNNPGAGPGGAGTGMPGFGGFGMPSLMMGADGGNMAQEYMKLQNDFFKWQDQLMQNQQVLHSRVAPLAANPPTLHGPGVSCGGEWFGGQEMTSEVSEAQKLLPSPTAPSSHWGVVDAYSETVLTHSYELTHMNRGKGFGKEPVN